MQDKTSHLQASHHITQGPRKVGEGEEEGNRSSKGMRWYLTFSSFFALVHQKEVQQPSQHQQQQQH